MLQLKVARAERLRREEQLALAELRRAVASLQNMDSSLKQHERVVGGILHNVSIISRTR